MLESPREKAARRLSTKADPRMAMSEVEPCKLFLTFDEREVEGEDGG